MSAELKAQLDKIKADIVTEVKSLVDGSVSKLKEELTGTGIDADAIVAAVTAALEVKGEALKVPADVEQRLKDVEAKLSRDIDVETKGDAPGSLGGAITGHETYEAFSKSTQEVLTIELKGDLFGFGEERKSAPAFMGHSTIGALDRGYDFQPITMLDRNEIRIRDLFTTIPITSDTARYVKQTVAYEVKTELREDEASGATVMRVKSGSGFYNGQTIKIVGVGGIAERTISDIDYDEDGATITLGAILGVGGALAKASVSGTTFTWTPAGELSPSAEVEFEELSATVKDLPIEMTVSVNMLQDAGATRGLIDAQLRLYQGSSEDREFLYGTGVGREMLGLFNHPEINVYEMSAGPVSDNKSDAIRRAGTQVALGHNVATAVLISPLDLETIELDKDDEGRYLNVAVTDASGLTRIRRLIVVESTECKPGKAMIGNFKAAVILWVRMQTVINIFRQHKGYASRRLALVQAMQRCVLTVIRSASLFVVDFEN